MGGIFGAAFWAPEASEMMPKQSFRAPKARENIMQHLGFVLDGICWGGIPGATGAKINSASAAIANNFMAHYKDIGF